VAIEQHGQLRSHIGEPFGKLGYRSCLFFVVTVRLRGDCASSVRPRRSRRSSLTHPTERRDDCELGLQRGVVTVGGADAEPKASIACERGTTPRRGSSDQSRDVQGHGCQTEHARNLCEIRGNGGAARTGSCRLQEAGEVTGPRNAMDLLGLARDHGHLTFISRTRHTFLALALHGAIATQPSPPAF
jgi:hypothetical protein